MLKIIKKLLSIGLPLAVTRLIQPFTTFIVMLFIAQLGHQALAASFTIAITRLVILVIFLSPLFSIGPIVSRHCSQQSTMNETNSTQLTQQGWIIALLLSLFPMLIFFQIKNILTVLHQPTNLTYLVNSYFTFYKWGIPAIYLSTVNQQYLAGIKKQHHILCLNIGMCFVSILLNFCLIFGYAGFPALGISGAGLAAVIAAWLGFIASTFLNLQLSPIKHTKLRLSHFSFGKKIIKIGVPIGLRTGSDLLLMFILMLFIGSLGYQAMAASQITNEYLILALLPLFGLGEATAIMTGQAVNETSVKDLINIDKAGLIIVTCFTLCISIVFLLFHRPLIDLYIDFSQSNASQIYDTTCWLLAIRVLKMLISGPIKIHMGLLRGTYDTHFSMLMSILTSWLLTLPLAYLLGFYLDYGVIGIAVASVFAQFVLIISLIIRWKNIVKNYSTAAIKY